MAARSAADVDVGRDHDEVEPEIDEAFERLVEEGENRLSRSWAQLLATGTVAGTEVAVGVLALLAVEEATGSPLLAGIAFSVGFLALLLGRSELFTEGFLVPVTAVAAKHGTGRDLIRLWSATLVSNLLGGFAILWVMMRAYPELHDTANELGETFATAGFTLQSFCLAVIAGSTLTLMTRMQQGTDEMIGKIVAAIAGGFLVAGLQTHHAILDSLIMFAAFHTGDAPFGYLDWLRWLGPALVGNMLGGLLLVTLLRLVRSSPRLRQERHDQEQRPAK